METLFNLLIIVYANVTYLVEANAWKTITHRMSLIPWKPAEEGQEFQLHSKAVGCISIKQLLKYLSWVVIMMGMHPPFFRVGYDHCNHPPNFRTDCPPWYLL